MLSDCSSFQYVNPESTANSWYASNEDNMILSDNTRVIVEKILDLYPDL